MEYVKEQQKFDREERAAWRNIRMTDLQTEAEEKRRADEIKVQMAKIEAENALNATLKMLVGRKTHGLLS